jgi:predicted metal-binding membrane protein
MPTVGASRNSLKSCRAIMLVMAVVGHSSLVWMLALTALVAPRS